MNEEYAGLEDVDLQRQIQEMQAELVLRAQAREQEEQDREAAIHAAIAELDALIGPDNPVKTATPDTIAEMKLFTEAELQSHTGKAHWLSIRGLDIIARTVRNIAAAR